MFKLSRQILSISSSTGRLLIAAAAVNCQNATKIGGVGGGVVVSIGHFGTGSIVVGNDNVGGHFQNIASSSFSFRIWDDHRRRFSNDATVSQKSKLMEEEEDGQENDQKWIAEENWARRVELAVAYRAMEKYGMHEGVCNHLTVMAPTVTRKEPVMLLVPHGLYWSQVTPACFLGLDVATGDVVEGSGMPELTAHVIHRAIYRHRADVQSVMHAHPTHATILGVLKDSRIKMIHQNSTRFLHNVAYDDVYGAIANDENTECDRMAKTLGDKEVLVMGHHGLLTVGQSVAVAFDLHYYFEQAAKVQILAYQTNQELREMSMEVVEKAFREIQATKHLYAEAHLNGIKNVLIDQDPRGFL